MTFKIFIFGIGMMLSHVLIAESNHSTVNSQSSTKENRLELDEIIQLAKTNDPWLLGNQYTQDSVKSLSVAAGTLPDPKISLGLANIASDSFQFNQEAMTQVKLGISQMFPRGDSLAIKQQQLANLEKQFPYQRQDRKAKVTVSVSQLWLDAYKAQQSIALIESDRVLFEQLVDVAEASYSSTVGKTRQQDLVRAQLELTRLDDRLTQLNQKLDASKQRLAEWFIGNGGRKSESASSLKINSNTDFSVAVELPQIELINPALISQDEPRVQQLVEMISRHPAVVAIDQKLKASQSSVELAKQKYKPEWGVTASYGYRDASPLGQPRSDLFSVGVSFDLPLFTENRQDQQLRAATSKKATVKTKRWLVLRRLIASFKSTRAQLLRLVERQKLFKRRLLPQMHDQAEASLTAYTNDDGDFAEVVRSRIAELNARIDALNINVDIQKNIVQLNYFLIESNKQDSDKRAFNKQYRNQKITTQLTTLNNKVSGLGVQND